MEYLLSKIFLFILVLIRIATISVIMPFIGYRTINKKVKIAFAVVLTLLIIPLLPSTQLASPPNILVFLFLIIKEVVTGLIIGFASNLIFMSFIFAGTIIGMQMGFDMAQVLDPQTGGQISLICQFLNITAMLVFLSINGHHFLIQSLFYSFKIIPLTGGIFKEGLANKIIQMTAQVFVLAIKIGVPAIATLLLTNVALGILARAVPQMNVFMVGFSLKIGIGIFSLITFLPLFTYLFRKIMEIFQADVYQILKLISP